MGRAVTDENRAQFTERVNRLERERSKLAKGYIVSVNKSGLIVAKPKRQSLRFPWMGLVFVAAFLMLFKAYLYLSLGAGIYLDRVSKLSEGNFVEKAGAFVMQADPATVWVAQNLRVVLE